MGDLEYTNYAWPIMSEIITVDSSNSLTINKLHQHPSNANLPKSSIAVVHTIENIKGTGFIIAIHPKGPILLTCKHVAIDVFTQTNRSCFACFDTSQTDYSISNSYSPGRHICGLFYYLELIEVASNLYDQSLNEIDLITNTEYSVDFDAALFVVKNICSCGVNFPLPCLFPLRLYENPSNYTQISVIGFMGEISESSSPLKAFTQQELNEFQSHYFNGLLTESEGEINSIGNIAVISCPTTPGFSGSPVVCRNKNGEVEVWGLFLGGPALPEHKTFINIANCYLTDQVLAMNMLSQLPDEVCPMKNFILNRNIPFISGVKYQYANVIYLGCTRGRYSQSVLNHNLCLPLSRIKGFLHHHGISLKK